MQSEEEPIAGSVAPQFAESAAEETDAVGAESMMVGDGGKVADAVPADALEAVAETEAADSGEPAMPVPAETTAAADQNSGEPAMLVPTETTAVADQNSGEPATPVAAETTEAADPIGSLLAESPPAAIATETIDEDAGDPADPATIAPSPPAKTTSGVSNAASPKTTAAVAAVPLPPPPPPLPKRTPKVAPSVATEAARSAPRPERPSRPEATPKQAQAGAQQAPARSGPGPWFPMALAPANKPLAAQPAARPSNAAYAGKVWAALARNKPRAGQKGSATVVFSIGAGGALGGVRIGQSSGNTKIDQLALATVRGAGPFPPPPSGVASFSIRIDFQ
jgi:protein TonB